MAVLITVCKVYSGAHAHTHHQLPQLSADSSMPSMPISDKGMSDVQLHEIDNMRPHRRGERIEEISYLVIKYARYAGCKDGRMSQRSSLRV
jgi:hypothetical protein